MNNFVETRRSKLDNREIIRLLKTAASLLELHAQSSKDEFKIRSYNNAVFSLEKVEKPLAALSLEELGQIEGVGKSIAANIHEINLSGSFNTLQSLLEITPAGVIDMLAIKGVGPKKIKLIWQDLKIESIADLLQACYDRKICKLKGFGDKTEESIKQALLYKLGNVGKFLYADAEILASEIEYLLKTAFPQSLISVTGALRRKLEVIEKLEFLVGLGDPDPVDHKLENLPQLIMDQKISGPFSFRGKHVSSGAFVEVLFCKKADYYNKLILHTGSKAHLSVQLESGKNLLHSIAVKKLESEAEGYALVGLSYIEPELREGTFEINLAQNNALPALVEMKDLKGVLHNHSTYSDGKNSLEDMAKHCLESGYEYFGISDHSKAAFYANGLDEYRVKKQQEEIGMLNLQLAPFKIFKGIESDILNDGSLDFAEDVLQSFDFVVASIHSNLGMDVTKATDRLIKAIANPRTTMLGHPTGRQLLRREGYPIDHKAVIDACAAYGVILEVNANPRRLDVPWEWINYALQKQVLISINPDAHEKANIRHMLYGVNVARKGGLSKAMTFNSFSRAEVENYFDKRKKAALA